MGHFPKSWPTCSPGLQLTLLSSSPQQPQWQHPVHPPPLLHSGPPSLTLPQNSQQDKTNTRRDGGHAGAKPRHGTPAAGAGMVGGVWSWGFLKEVGGDGGTRAALSALVPSSLL